MEPLLLIIIAVILLVCLISYITTLNKLRRLNIKVDEALSGIDVALAKRYDVLTKMVDVVKGYTKYEQETLFEIVRLRSNMSINEMNEANNAMDNNHNRINVIAENYPELKASENFKVLELSITDVEEHLQAARRLYNSNVSIYNQSIATFPSSIVASIHKMVERDFFEADKIQRKNVKVNI